MLACGQPGTGTNRPTPTGPGSLCSHPGGLTHHSSRPGSQHFTVCRPLEGLLDKRTPSRLAIGVPTGGQNERGGRGMKKQRSRRPCGYHRRFTAFPPDATGASFSHRLLDKYLDYLLSAGPAACTASAATLLEKVRAPLKRNRLLGRQPGAAPPTSASMEASEASQRRPARPCWPGHRGNS